MGAVLHYVHDPMCSWCWGYRPTWLRLRDALPRDVTINTVLGGLAPDNEQPMPPALQASLQGHWRRIASELGTSFNFDFWTRCQPRRSTYPACRAVIAAARQNREEDMILAIQRAYYLRAMNPSDSETLETLAAEEGLDIRQFSDDLEAPSTQDALLAQINTARAWRVPGFPSLVLERAESLHAITLDYRDHRVSLQSIVAVA
jgi:putative protein-disulfide isomerase